MFVSIVLIPWCWFDIRYLTGRRYLTVRMSNAGWVSQIKFKITLDKTPVFIIFSSTDPFGPIAKSWISR